MTGEKRVRARFSVFAIARDIIFVMLGKYGQYVVTLVTLPLTARILGTTGVGHLAIGMSGYFIGSLVVDLGITSFLAARVGDDDINQIRGNYFAIRATVLSAVGISLLVGLMMHAGTHVWMILLGLFVGGFSAISEDWLLIGAGRFGSSILYQASGRIVYLVLLFTLLPQFPTATTALMCLFYSSILSVSLTWWDSLRHFGLPPRPRDVGWILRIGGPVFASRLLVSTYGQGAPAVYSSVLDAASLGLYSASDRVVRAIQAMLDPIGLALLPRMAQTGEERFWGRSMRALAAIVGVATAATVCVWVAAPLIVNVVFGAKFAGAIPIMRFESLILPATAITSFSTTAVLSVLEDSIGVLIGAVIGTVITICSVLMTIQTRSVWTLVYGTITAECCVAAWFAFRLWRHAANNRTPRQVVTEPVEPAGVAPGEMRNA
ncbi:lipopolysaccharide biosynthesis protein [Gordonia polyisoprenivorans]|uniref:lipopolysaccharide biosynthesis protein n=1 Tax=Gordonia polyisoprenivorans TaxID=84595 RepID=UPI001AD77581|nr:oligosaccharide flippase family protein [Gordonia polyisoprenivorans]QTI70573.1 oligosaccharide flippase family protein [Gordonia polyisoprenivorans]